MLGTLIAVASVAIGQAAGEVITEAAADTLSSIFR